MDADVAVVGVGSIGSLVMWELAGRGVDVIGFEQHAPGHDRGAAGGETRLFRVAYSDGAAYIPLLRRSREAWLRLCEESGHRLFEPCGGLTIGSPQQRQILDLQANAAAEGVPVEVLSAGEMAERYPQHRLLDGEIGVFDAAAGMVRCDLAVLAAAEVARARGAQVVARSPVVAVRPGRDAVHIDTADRTWRVRQVVIAAGAWSGGFLPAQWASRVEPRRIALGWYAPEAVAQYRPEVYPVVIRVTHDLFLYGAPTVDGATVKVGGTQQARAIPDPDSFDRRHSREETEVAREVISEFFTSLRPEPLRMDAFTDLYTTDERPVLGRVGDGGRVVVATGGSGRGFKMAPALAAAAADAVVDGTDAPIPFLSPTRSAPA
ncbi:N-methyl-L-tryptophan oxidase [Saccharopolyspora sp. WRP15-2]|uniref:N-methyl-L-tryptophan oxidase n=1 Tax=Saccharopolyspora oryzae TaxID=2997343 RepID=A0ABT4UYR6_9PSEU|nr:N-methyl-L-tryptophan oxidase [Saccharopolyspora oryzae]MDA3626341.1 N-methyl-L-tryptophan oxidase [Saccharopolyspora oryzae]